MAVKRPGLFGASSGGRLFKQSATGIDTTATAGEIDLRVEFDGLIYGDDYNVRHGSPIVIRHLRRGSNGAPTDCACKDSFTRESDPDCSYCLGERYLWDETWYLTYSMYSGSQGGLANRVLYMPPGALRTDQRIFFFRFDTPIRYGDKIVEMKLDAEGGVVTPYVRRGIYRPQTIQEYRSDGGRIEYIAVYCKEESALRPDEAE